MLTRRVTRMWCTALVSAAVATACPGQSGPGTPTTSTTTIPVTTTSTTTTVSSCVPLRFIPWFVEWNGAYGDAPNLRFYLDSGCSIEPSGEVSEATIDSPASPPPPGYSSWYDLPPGSPIDFESLFSSAEAVQAATSCAALFGVSIEPLSSGGLGYAVDGDQLIVLTASYVPWVAAERGNAVDGLWSCRIVDSGPSGSQVRP